MVETSFYWDGLVTGDATLAPYTATVFHRIWSILFARTDNQGVIESVLNELEVTGIAGGVQINTGSGLVNGGKYRSDSSVTVAIPTPSSNPRIDRIVLRRDWTTQTTRIFRIAGTEAGSPSAPAMTQIAGTLWDVPLAQVLITTAGVITVTNEREFCRTPLATESQWDLIETLSPGGEGNIDFTNIPQTFRHLKMVGQVIADQSSTGDIWYNGDDTAANYQRAIISALGAAPAAAANENLGILVNFGGAVITAGHATQFELAIANYARSDIFKMGIQDEVVIHQQTDTTTYAVSKEGVLWKNTDPVTRLLIEGSAGILLTSSVVSLYGM